MSGGVLHLAPPSKLIESDRDHAAHWEPANPHCPEHQSERDQDFRNCEQPGSCSHAEPVAPTASARCAPHPERNGNGPAKQSGNSCKKQRIERPRPEQGKHGTVVSEREAKVAFRGQNSTTRDSAPEETNRACIVSARLPRSPATPVGSNALHPRSRRARDPRIGMKVSKPRTRARFRGQLGGQEIALRPRLRPGQSRL